MEFVLIYPVKRNYLDKDLIRNVAVAAERAGFKALLSWDHYMLPDGPDTLDAWSILGYLAGQTSSIKLGTVVTPIPFRPPSQLAKIVSSVDVLSGGRTILGVGAGWHQPEFDGFSKWESAGRRVDQTGEALDLITRLWTGEPVTFEGSFYKSEGGHISPAPIQSPHPPLWFGVRGKRMLNLAARYGEAWIPTNISPKDYSAGLQELRSIQKRLGIKREMEGALQNFEVFTDAGACKDTIAQFEEAGCRHYGSVWSYPPDEMVSRIHWFAENVMP